MYMYITHESRKYLVYFKNNAELAFYWGQW